MTMYASSWCSLEDKVFSRLEQHKRNSATKDREKIARIWSSVDAPEDPNDTNAGEQVVTQSSKVGETIKQSRWNWITSSIT